MRRGILDRRTTGEWFALILFTAVICYQAFVPPITGMANNSDFGKVFDVFRLRWPLEDEYKFITVKYEFDLTRPRVWEYFSTEQALTAAALGLNTLTSKDGKFDIRTLGAVHALLYVLSFYLLQPLLRRWGNWARIPAYALLITMFGDAMYVTWLNCAYSDVSAFLFLMLMLVLYLRTVVLGGRADRFGFLAAAILFTAAKNAHCLLAVPVMALILWKGSSWAGRTFRMTSVVLLFVTMALTWSISPAFYAPIGRYSVIFYELLPHSKDPSTHLRELGMDDSWRRAIGTFSYQAGSPFQEPGMELEFRRRTSHWRLGLFLLRHPTLAYWGIRYSLNQAGRQRAKMGNFPRGEGFPEEAESHAFAVWSGFKARLFENRGPAYLFYSLGLMGILCVGLWRRMPPMLPAGLCLCLMALLAMGIGSFGEALETTRHFFLYNGLMDLILMSGVTVWALNKEPDRQAGPPYNSR